MTRTYSMNIRLDLMLILTVILAVLKLTGIIAWSWLWVLSPLWAPVALVLLIISIFSIIKTFFA